ncbi:uncharacterized protein LOC114398230 [Glycine soja]|uniref:uncharacterized protein LOC114398230 n=1 Tax=Glycine soja TaxID=3848 RepID=UPI00103EF1A9|nr:uncharacterized protein LOC114398230 [Glycine soja]
MESNFHVDVVDSAMDCIEAVIMELTPNKLKLAVAVNTMATIIDDLLQRPSLRNHTPYFPSSVPTQAPIPAAIISTSPPMPIPPLCPTIMQQHPTPLPASLTFVVLPLLANNKPHASSGRRWAFPKSARSIPSIASSPRTSAHFP